MVDQSDGQRQLESYSSTLITSTAYLRALASSSSSKAWKLVPPLPTLPSGPNASLNSTPGKIKHPAHDPSNVIVHRRSGTGGEVWRATTEIDAKGRKDGWTTEGFAAILQAPETRVGWDRMVESATTLEQLDENTRIVKTAYKLGWPSSPRDTVTIQRTVTDETTVVFISASLPRSPDEPAYLRPSPPYVRAHVSLLAFCIQLPSSTTTSTIPPVPLASVAALGPSGKNIRISCFWQLDFRGTWAVGSGIGLHLPAVLTNMVDYAREAGDRVPTLESFGRGVSLGPTSFDVGRDTLNVEYTIVAEEENYEKGSTVGSGDGSMGVDEHLTRIGGKEDITERDGRVPARTLEFALPRGSGSRVQITVKSFVPEDDSTPRWTALVGRVSNATMTPQLPSFSSSPSSPSSPPASLILRLSHPPLPTELTQQLLRIKLSIARDPSSKTVRINGVPSAIVDLPPSTTSSSPSSSRPKYSSSKSKRVSNQFGFGSAPSDDSASLSGVSLRTIESIASSLDSTCPSPSGDDHEKAARQRLVSSESSVSGNSPPLLPAERSEKANRTIRSLIRRNYIYFLSLLQEPEAKWRHVLDAAKGVSVQQLDSIDKTLVVYHAQAVFVGVGVWDLLAAIGTPGTRGAWDRGFEEAVLVEDVNELSELWWWKYKGSWPAYYPRDSVLLKTTYKSPDSVHVFSFSAEDHNLFPAVPPTDPSSIIRTQVDLQGWSIEALSPNTTQVTLLEQSDPKGWTKKGTIPQTMADMLAGIGEFAIRSGGPPIVTRLTYARCISSRYDLEKSTLRFEYQASAHRSAQLASEPPATAATTSTDLSAIPHLFKTHRQSTSMPIECELRCDTDTWSTSLDIVIDPPPVSVTCLRRHKLSSGGGGSWLVITHDPILLEDEHVVLMVRKGAAASTSIHNSKDKHVVLVNGTKIKVDIEDLAEADVKLLSKQKRVKPTRIPLDQPPVLGAVRARSKDSTSNRSASPSQTPASSIDGSSASSITTITGAALRFASPFTRLIYPTFAMPSPSVVLPPLDPPVPASTVSAVVQPMQQALDALDSLRLLHSQSQDAASWTAVSSQPPADSLLIEKRLIPHVSTAFPVHRASRVIQGSTAEDVCSVVGHSGGISRRVWDERFEERIPLESFGNGCETAFVSSKTGGLVFRDRGFYLASLTAMGAEPNPTTPKTGSSPANSPLSTIFHVSSSFAIEGASVSFNPAKVNPNGLPIGTQFIEGWVMETLDPYGNEKFIIPSTRLTYFISIDFAGSMASLVTANINATIPRVLLSVESYLQSRHSIPRLRSPATGLLLDLRRDDLSAPASSAVELKAWNLQGLDTERVALGTSFDLAEGEFKASIYLRLNADAEDPTNSPPLPLARTSSLLGAWHTPPLSIPEASHISRRIVSTPTLSQPEVVTPSPDLQLQPTSSRSLRQPPSVVSTMSRSSSATIVDHISESRPSRREKDYLVCQVELDTKSFPAGYNISCTAFLAPELIAEMPLPTKTSDNILPTHLPLTITDRSPSSALELPVKVVVRLLPTPATHSASLSSSRPRRKHSISITLPTSQYSASVVSDPLQSTPKARPKRPTWLDLLETRGVVLQLKIAKLAGEAYDDGLGDIIVAHEGIMLEVDKRERSNSAGSLLTVRPGDESEGGFLWPRLYRTLFPPGTNLSTSATSATPALPPSLRAPIAVSDRLLLDSDPTTAQDVMPATSSRTRTVRESTNPVTPKELALSSTPTILHPHPRKISNASIPILSFFNPYFARLSTNSPTNEVPNRVPSSLDSLTQSVDPRPIVVPGLVTPHSSGTAPSSAAADPADLHKCDSSSTPTVNSAILATPQTLLSFAHDKHHPPTFSLLTVLLVAVMSFLVGSLFRSLLSPADFIAFIPAGSEDEVAAMMLQGGVGGGAGEDRVWRELRRFLEIKRGWWGMEDVVVGVIRR